MREPAPTDFAIVSCSGLPEYSTITVRGYFPERQDLMVNGIKIADIGPSESTFFGVVGSEGGGSWYFCNDDPVFTHPIQFEQISIPGRRLKPFVMDWKNDRCR